MSTATRVGLRSGFSLSRNLSLFTIPAVYMTAFMPHLIKFIRMSKGYDNVKPRAGAHNYDKICAGKTPEETAKFKDEMERLTAMHNNGMEQLPLFFTAIIIGNYARLPTRLLSFFSLSYFFSRIAYNILYFRQTTPRTALARTLTWLSGMTACLFVLAKSAKKVYDL